MNEKLNYKELYEAARRESENLKRKVLRLERDKKYNAVMTQNIERMRDFNSAEKERQFLYNQLLLANCPDMIFVLDEGLQFILGTVASYGDLRYSTASELADKPLKKIFERRFPAEWVARLEAACSRAMQSRARQKYGGRLQDNDGETLFMDVTVSPAIDPAGKCMGVVIVLHDVTEITLLKEKAEQSSSAKSAFLANMSHEIRTPMNAIKGMADLMMMTDLSSVQSKYLKNISSASTTLIKIINDILDYSKIDAEKMELVPARYDSLSLFNDVASIIYLKAAGKGLDFVADIAPNIPAEMFGDELRLKQVLLNLLNNATKFTNKGEVCLTVECEEQFDGVVRLFFAISDTGIGIREEEKERLFSAFSRLDLARNRTSEGTGLGLVIASRIVELMGGTLAVNSRYGEGSTFSFSILQKNEGCGVAADLSALPGSASVLLLGRKLCGPCLPVFKRLGVPLETCPSPETALSPAALACTHVFYEYAAWNGFVQENRERFAGSRFTAVLSLQQSENALRDMDVEFIYEPVMLPAIARRLRAAAPADEASSAGPRHMGNFKLQGASLLVVDDNEINLMVCCEILKHYGVEPDVATSGAEAFEMAQAKRYDMIFMDHMMPGMDGLETTQKIRAESEMNRETPIIALTANAIVGMRESFLAGGMNDYVSKPIEIEEIDRVLMRFIPRQKIQLE